MGEASFSNQNRLYEKAKVFIPFQSGRTQSQDRHAAVMASSSPHPTGSLVSLQQLWVLHVVVFWHTLLDSLSSKAFVALLSVV